MDKILVIDSRYGACTADALVHTGSIFNGTEGTFVPVAGSSVSGAKRRMTVVQTTPRVLPGSSGAG